MLDMDFPVTDIEKRVQLVVPEGLDLNGISRPSFNVTGHIDGILSGDTILDIKSMNQNSFKQVQRLGVGEDYLAQVNSYMHATGLTKAIIWCYCKDTSERLLVEIKYDPQLQEKIFQKFMTVAFYEEGDTLPERPYEPYEQFKNKAPTGLIVLHFKCNYCPFTQVCFPDFTQDLTSDKPKFVKYNIEDEL